MVSFSAVVLPGAASFGLMLRLALSNVSATGFGMLLTSDAGAPGASGRCADAGEAEKPNTITPKKASAAPVVSDRRRCAVDGRMARSPGQNDSTGLADHGIEEWQAGPARKSMKTGKWGHFKRVVGEKSRLHQQPQS